MPDTSAYLVGSEKRQNKSCFLFFVLELELGQRKVNLLVGMAVDNEHSNYLSMFFRKDTHNWHT